MNNEDIHSVPSCLKFIYTFPRVLVTPFNTFLLYIDVKIVDS